MDGHRRAALLAVAVAAVVSGILVALRRRVGQSAAAETAPPDPSPPLSSQPLPNPNLDGLTRAELYERAQAIDLPGRSKMSKAELRAALSSRE